MRGRVAEEAAAFALALGFLTRLPVGREAHSPARMRASTVWLPLAGMAVGAFSAGVFLAGAQVLPPVVALLLATAATLLLTGALHEDGLADTADGLGARTRERALEIMRDSRIGAHGALALGLVLALRIAALEALPVPVAAVALVAAGGASRASAVLVVATSRYARAEGAGGFTTGGPGRRRLVVALVPVLAGLVLVAWAAGWAAAGGAVLGLAAGHGSRLLWERRLGGYTGDTLGATQQVSEVGMVLGVLACM